MIYSLISQNRGELFFFWQTLLASAQKAPSSPGNADPRPAAVGIIVFLPSSLSSAGVETHLLYWLHKWRVLENEYLINAEYRTLRHEEVAGGRRSSEMHRCPAAWQRASADESFSLYPHFLSSALLLCATSWPISWPCTLAVRLFWGVFFPPIFFPCVLRVDLHFLVAVALPFSQKLFELLVRAKQLGGRRRRRQPFEFPPRTTCALRLWGRHGGD